MIYLIDHKVKSEIASLKKFSEENIWSLDNLLLQKRGKMSPPGDDPNYVRILWDSVKVVFTITEQPKFNTRHMSISMMYSVPHPTVIEEIMGMLGYSGKLESCTVFREESGSAINIVERIK